MDKRPQPLECLKSKKKAEVYYSSLDFFFSGWQL